MQAKLYIFFLLLFCNAFLATSCQFWQFNCNVLVNAVFFGEIHFFLFRLNVFWLQLYLCKKKKSFSRSAGYIKQVGLLLLPSLLLPHHCSSPFLNAPLSYYCPLPYFSPPVPLMLCHIVMGKNSPSTWDSGRHLEVTYGHSNEDTAVGRWYNISVIFIVHLENRVVLEAVSFQYKLGLVKQKLLWSRGKVV